MSRLIPGAPIIWKDRSWVLLDIPAIDRVLVRDPKTGEIELAPSNELKAAEPQKPGVQGLMAISGDDWQEAWEKFEAIRPLLQRGRRKKTREEIDDIAKSFGKDRATVYRWISKWEKNKTVSALVRSERSDVGRSRLASQVEEIIRDQIDTYYLTRERPSIVELWERVSMACRQQELKVPNLSTIRRRVDRLQDRLVVAKRYSAKMARENYEPLRGSFPGADVPLAVYQVDHSPIDMFVVDEQYRKEIGRGYLTIVTDTCTRMLAGFYVSLDPPGAASAGLALSHAILSKAKWLADRDIDSAWPIQGIPSKIYADNAAEFRGTMLGRACREYGIILENRPKGQPNYGGHVERLFRTFMHRIQTLPGTTFSNVEEKGDYKSQNRAAMTLDEFERWFATFVTKVYHHRPHRGIGRVPPLKLYEQFILGTDTKLGIGLPEPIHNEFKLRLDFMPFVDRTIQEYGVVIDNIHYYADVLRPWIHARDPDNAKLKRKFIFARDPRDISEIYFFDPETKTYYPVPYRNVTRPRMSVWELNAVLKHIAAKPELQPDEDTIFEGLEEMAQIEREASELSRKARRGKQRRLNWRDKPAQLRELVPNMEIEPRVFFNQESIEPFDEIEESK